MSATPGRIFSITLLIVLFVTGIWFSTHLVVFATRPADPSSENKIVIEVQKGLKPGEISRLLADKGIVRDSQQFYWLGRLLLRWRGFKAGEYEFSPKMSPLEVFSILNSGISVIHSVTVHEGDNMYQIAQAIEQKGLARAEGILTLCRDSAFIQSFGFASPPPTLEGYLYPETYFFTRSLAPSEMLTRMVQAFFRNWTPDLDQGAKRYGFSQHDVVIFASMIEKETGASQERPLISSVFHNRMKKKMRFQSDPTTIYGMWERYTGNITKADLREKTPYNTYTVDGLPAGPISNPGIEALRAAVNPATSEYLYFVSRNDGTHIFSKNYGDHERAVNDFQRNHEAREGKSWRNLNESGKEVQNASPNSK